MGRILGGVNVAIRFSKLIVALVIILNVIFAAAVLFVYLKVGSEPTALITAFFSFTVGELYLLAKIKRDGPG